MPFCVQCGQQLTLSFKFCPSCGSSTEAAFALLAKNTGSGTQGDAESTLSREVWDLSGNTDFALEATITTNRDAGTILGKPFPSGLWRNGGGEGQGKMLFLRGGKLCFDIGWVGCVTGRTKVSDNRPHHVQLRFSEGTYKIFVDGALDGSGLHSVPDHPETIQVQGVAIGHSVSNGKANGDMAPDFNGSITNVKYFGADEDVEVGFVKVPEATLVPIPAAVTAEVTAARISAIRNCSSGDTPKNLGGGLVDQAHFIGKAHQSSNYGGGMDANKAIRGSFSSPSGFGGIGTYSHTSANDRDPAWQVKFSRPCAIKEVHVYGRPGYERRLKNVSVTLLGRGNEVLLKKDFPNSENAGAFKLDLGAALANVVAVSLQKMKPLQRGDERTFNLNAVQAFGW
mmetsp:Transcript_3308/g.6961  ORF Transcript_3308/g.6961 Transcript_3308/m.6961 type:complete len:397 (+) Transcript_3308:29-1219(+)